MAEFFTFVSGALISYVLLLFFFYRRQMVLARVAEVAQRQVNQTGSTTVPFLQTERLQGWRTALSSWKLRAQREAESAGVHFSGKEWRMLFAIAALAILCAGMVGRSLAASLTVAAAEVVFYRYFIARRKRQRMNEFDEHLGDMLTIAAGALRAGYSFLQAVDILAAETKGQMAEECRRMLREMTLGVGVEEALTHAAQRIGSADFELIVDAVLIQRQVGGNLAEVLDIAGETIRERMRIKGEIRSLTAQGRMSMWIFVLLTPAIALILFIFNPSYISLLWQSSAGILMILLAVCGQIVGTMLIRKIVRIDV